MLIAEVWNVLDIAFKARVTPVLRGLHGIGKSESVKQFTEKNKFHLVELFLSTQEVGDLIGTPYEEDGVHYWTKPSWLKRMEDAAENGQINVLFFDELNRAPLDVRQAMMQTILNKVLHDHPLPVTIKDGVEYPTMIVAAVNPTHGYQVDEMDDALKDRVMIIETETDAPSWLNLTSLQTILISCTTLKQENKMKSILLHVVIHSFRIFFIQYLTLKHSRL